MSDAPKISAIFSGILAGIICEAHGDDYLSDDDDDVQIMVTNSEGKEILVSLRKKKVDCFEDTDHQHPYSSRAKRLSVCQLGRRNMAF